MGERILREEGFEVITVTDGQTALMRLADVDPDVVFADVSLPRKTGYDICREIKRRPRHKHVRVILTAGLLESFDEGEAAAIQCDGILKKPFEASAVLAMLKPLVDSAQKDRAEYGPGFAVQESGVVSVKVVTDPDELAPFPLAGDVDVERVRAAVTIALDAALPAMIDKITEQVLVALGH
jgi:DNA-binding response OmpR family regulator